MHIQSQIAIGIGRHWNSNSLISNQKATVAAPLKSCDNIGWLRYILCTYIKMDWFPLPPVNAFHNPSEWQWLNSLNKTLIFSSDQPVHIVPPILGQHNVTWTEIFLMSSNLRCYGIYISHQRPLTSLTSSLSGPRMILERRKQTKMDRQCWSLPFVWSKSALVTGGEILARCASHSFL